MGIVSEIFFPDPKGDYLRHETVEKYFRENSERILKRRVTPHMLRHTHVSLMIEAAMTAGQNITLDDIAERLGHANSKITKDIYFHKTNLVRDATNRKLDLLKILWIFRRNFVGFSRLLCHVIMQRLDSLFTLFHVKTRYTTLNSSPLPATELSPKNPVFTRLSGIFIFSP